MYKVFINKGYVTIGSEPVSIAGGELVLNLLCEEGDPLESYVNELIHHRESRHVHLFSSSPEALIRRFELLFEPVVAAGGIVFDESSQVLLIFRRGFWDFPKGKIEMGESPEQAAVREVEEETGVKILKLLHEIQETRHYYQDGDKRILKHNVWFRMLTAGQRPPLIPQIQEDIEKCIWCSASEAEQKITQGGYSSMQELIPALYL